MRVPTDVSACIAAFDVRREHPQYSFLFPDTLRKEV